MSNKISIDEWSCQDSGIPDFNVLKKYFPKSGTYEITVKNAGGCGMGSYPAKIVISKAEE